jgi:hypothetical protein
LEKYVGNPNQHVGLHAQPSTRIRARRLKRTSTGWLNELWRAITGGQFPIVTDYFGDTIRMQALLLLSNRWDEP